MVVKTGGKLEAGVGAQVGFGGQRLGLGAWDGRRGWGNVQAGGRRPRWG